MRMRTKTTERVLDVSSIVIQLRSLGVFLVLQIDRALASSCAVKMAELFNDEIDESGSTTTSSEAATSTNVSKYRYVAIT